MNILSIKHKQRICSFLGFGCDGFVLTAGTGERPLRLLFGQFCPVQLVRPSHYSGQSLLPGTPEREVKRQLFLPPLHVPFHLRPQKRSCFCLYAQHRQGEKPEEGSGPGALEG